MAKVIDCIMYHSEADMVDLRCNILNDVVDYFVIVESGETHAGDPKPYNFPLRRFLIEYGEKIVYTQVETLYGDNAWKREKYHRACIEAAVDGLAINGMIDVDDWTLVNDADEIPDPKHVTALRSLNSNIVTAKFEMDFYYYNFNMKVQQGWATGAARHRLGLNPNDIRTCNWNAVPLHYDSAAEYNGGWHFSYMMTPMQVIDKVKSFMHAHDPIIRDLPRDPVYIADKMNAGLDLYGRDLTIERVLLSDTLPRYVLDNIDKYKALGWIVEA